MRVLIILLFIFISGCINKKQVSVREKAKYDFKCIEVGPSYERCSNTEIVCYKERYDNGFQCIKNEEVFQSKFNNIEEQI